MAGAVIPFLAGQGENVMFWGKTPAHGFMNEIEFKATGQLRFE